MATAAEEKVAEYRRPKKHEYDLTYTVASHLDRHMVLPLLDCLEENKMYAFKDIVKAKLDLINGTNMVDLAHDEYKRLHEVQEVPAELQQQRGKVLAELEKWDGVCRPLLNLILDEDTVTQLRSSGQFTREHLAERHQITDDMIDNLYRWSHVVYNCGRYRDSSAGLACFRLLSKDEEKNFGALWGKLAADILMTSWDDAMEDLHLLRETIEARTHVPQAVQLQQRVWLIHWSLFIFFNTVDGRGQMIEFLLQQERLLNAIQTACPHMLRYLTVAVIADKRRKNFLKDLVRTLRTEADTYSDPITEFVLSVWVDFDFPKAKALLESCDVVLTNDFFLASSKNEFMHQAHVFMFETIVRVYKYIDLSTLSQWLGLEDEKSAERSIVDFMRAARVDAKIDSSNSQLVVATSYPSLYQQVIDKTKQMMARSMQMTAAVDKKYATLDTTAED